MFDITKKREKTRGNLCAAIQARRIIEFYYHGGYRTVEPFAVGIVRKGSADNESLICYQTEGFSDLQENVGFKLYRASEIEEMKVSREQFTGDRPGYDPDDIDMVKVYGCIRLEKPVVKVIETPAVKAVEIPEPPPLDTVPLKPAPKTVTHNEMMQKFRFTHSRHTRELVT